MLFIIIAIISIIVVLLIITAVYLAPTAAVTPTPTAAVAPAPTAAVAPAVAKIYKQIVNPRSQLCIDKWSGGTGTDVRLLGCHGLGGNQSWKHNSDGTLESGGLCITVEGNYGDPLKLRPCTGASNQVWLYDAAAKAFKNGENCMDTWNNVSEGSLRHSSCHGLGGNQAFEYTM